MRVIEITDRKNKIHKYHAKTSQSIQWMVEGDFILIREYFPTKLSREFQYFSFRRRCKFGCSRRNVN